MTITKLNKVLEEIQSTGTTKTPGGKTIKVHGNIDYRKSKILTHLVQEIKPLSSLEVGLAYGVSALTICDALPKTAQSRHIIIDPHQNRKPVWGGIGLYNLKRAGFEDLIEFYEQPSYRALPILESRNTKIDFAFIDGWHTFDYTLVDFFYIDKILNTGGLVAFDDADWPSVRGVCRFIATNLDYSVYKIPGELLIENEPLKTPDQNSYNPLDIITKNLRAFFPQLGNEAARDADKKNDMNLGLRGNLIVFKKESDDSRKWDHFEPF